MNKGKYYILPENIKIEKITKELYSNGDGWGYQDEKSAEYSCAVGLICACGKITEDKHHLLCEDCRNKKEIVDYNKLEQVAWDGVTPLCLFSSDKYFFGEDEIYEYCEDEGIDIQSLDLVLCEPNEPPYFDINDYCIDYLPEDLTLDDYTAKNEKSALEVEEIVNNFLESISPLSWGKGNKRVSLK